VRGDRQDEQHGATAAVIAHAPPSAEDAFVAFPQHLIAAVRIAFTGRLGQRNAIEGERAAIGPTKW
jgi:hypothetical protein